MLDACVIGAGPNGLAAAITLARAGLRVELIEAQDRVGGGLQTRELTLPHVRHDVASSIHPMAVASPAFRQWPLHQFGLKWIYPPAPIAHAFRPTSQGALLMYQDLEETAEALGKDGRAWKRLFGPLVKEADEFLECILQPLTYPPRHVFTLAKFGIRALPSAEQLAMTVFQTPEARALFGGLAAHSSLPLGTIGTGAITLVLGILAHAYGYPFPQGGAQQLADALAAYFQSLGGTITLNTRIQTAHDLPSARVYLVDSSPGVLLQLLKTSGSNSAFYEWFVKQFRYGPGVQKYDYALSSPVPWLDPAMQQSATVHVGGSLEQMIASERSVIAQRPRPYVLGAQHSLFDPSRAPQGQHTLWAYSHVPNGSQEDIQTQLEDHIEEYAPGFKDTILQRHVITTRDLQAFSPVFQGGDVNGGAATLWQMLARPVLQVNPYRTPRKNMYLCSSSTPPGGAAHGMAGYHAARIALHDHF